MLQIGILAKRNKLGEIEEILPLYKKQANSKNITNLNITSENENKTRFNNKILNFFKVELLKQGEFTYGENSNV